MHLIDKDPMKKATSTASSTPAVKKDSLGKALIKKMSAPLTKAIRYFPEKHHQHKMNKLSKDYQFLKDYNARAKSGVENSDKDRAIMQMYKDRKPQ